MNILKQYIAIFFLHEFVFKGSILTSVQNSLESTKNTIICENGALK